MRTRFPLLYSLFNKTRRDVYLTFLRLSHGGSGPKEVFDWFYRRNLFGDSESLSGTGSTLAATGTIRAALPSLLSILDVNTILDIPCGDFFWAKEINWQPYHYIGADIVAGLVERNRSLYGSDSVEFQALDILTDTLPPCDLILCRDLFIHFPNELVRSALNNISGSGARFLLTTQYNGVKTNRDIKLGSFRPLNLMLPPFGLPEPLRSVPDHDYLKLWDRTLALWPLDAVVRAMGYDCPGPGMDR